MAEERVDSRTAATAILRMTLLSILLGAAAGLATWLFLTVDHLGTTFLWDQLPETVTAVSPTTVSVLVTILMTALATLVIAVVKRRPFDMGAAEAEYDEHGRMDPRNIIPGAAFSLFTLFSGASVGPEAPLTDINGGLGTLLAEKTGLPGESVKLLTYAGVAGAFGAFFGSAPVGALLAAELISPKALSLSRTQMVAGLAAGATGWTVYSLLGGHKIGPILTFANTQEPRVWGLVLALVLGLVGGVLGMLFGAVIVKLRVSLAGLRQRYWLAGLAGGVSTVLAVIFVPVLLFSGQAEVPKLIENAMTLGAIVLILLGIGKLVLTAWGLSTAYFGGPLFPLLFAGACFGLALNLLVPAIPQGIAVLGIATGMVTAAAVAPLSVTVFIALIAEPALAPVVAISSVAAFVIRQAIAPTLPGVYRAARAAETASETAEAK